MWYSSVSITTKHDDPPSHTKKKRTSTAPIDESAPLVTTTKQTPTLVDAEEEALFSLGGILHPLLALVLVAVCAGFFHVYMNHDVVQPISLFEGATQKFVRHSPPLMASPTMKKKQEAVEAARRTGIDILQEEEEGREPVFLWTGEYGGNTKPRGPLLGKRIGVLVASEFSDFQVYYLASYIGEYGGTLEFLLVDWVKWKFVRPNIANKGVRGLWDLSVDPIPVMGGSNKAANYKSLRTANPHDYDALIIVGGHSPDVMVTEKEVISFLQEAQANDAVLGSIGEGALLFIAAGLVHDKNCTGNQVVDYMLKEVASFQPGSPVVTDGKLVTARDTVDTPLFLQELCRVFDPDWKDIWKESLVGKNAVLLVGDDYEDIELVVPAMELLHRGADVIIGRFQAQFSARSPHLGSDFLVGNFGTTVPFQEIPDDKYTIKKLEQLKMSEFDIVMIPGGFNPQNIVATGTTKWLKKAYGDGKLIAALCHGPIPLAAANMVRGKKLTGFQASTVSVEVMGGDFMPECAAVIDGRIVSGRTPPEVPEWLDAITVALLD